MYICCRKRGESVGLNFQNLKFFNTFNWFFDFKSLVVGLFVRLKGGGCVELNGSGVILNHFNLKPHRYFKA